MTAVTKNIADKNHTFPHWWTTLYFLICIRAAAVCIICNENISALKEYNIKSHYKTNHALQLSGIHSQMGSKKQLSFKTVLLNSKVYSISTAVCIS
jgi:hypothetical protein